MLAIVLKVKVNPTRLIETVVTIVITMKKYIRKPALTGVIFSVRIQFFYNAYSILQLEL